MKWLIYPSFLLQQNGGNNNKSMNNNTTLDKMTSSLSSTTTLSSEMSIIDLDEDNLLPLNKQTDNLSSLKELENSNFEQIEIDENSLNDNINDDVRTKSTSLTDTRISSSSINNNNYRNLFSPRIPIQFKSNQINPCEFYTRELNSCRMNTTNLNNRPPSVSSKTLISDRLSSNNFNINGLYTNLKPFHNFNNQFIKDFNNNEQHLKNDKNCDLKDNMNDPNNNNNNQINEEKNDSIDDKERGGFYTNCCNEMYVFLKIFLICFQIL
jgi:hypothetical protein